VTGLLLPTRVQDATASPPPLPAEAGGYGLFLFETLLILVGVCVLAWLVLRFGVRRLYGAAGAAGAAGDPLRVVARLPLEPRRTVYIVEAAGKTLLVGASEAGPLTVLAELDERAVAAAVAATPRPRSFLEILNAKREKRPGET
jgi:flagellar biogenesis protein FliO